jgi:hypothetical protein
VVGILPTGWAATNGCGVPPGARRGGTGGTGGAGGAGSRAVSKAVVGAVWSSQDDALLSSAAWAAMRGVSGSVPSKDDDGPRIHAVPYSLHAPHAELAAGNLSILDPQPSTLNPQPSALNPQPLTLDPQPLTLDPYLLPYTRYHLLPLYPSSSRHRVTSLPRGAGGRTAPRGGGGKHEAAGGRRALHRRHGAVRTLALSGGV